MILEEFDTFLEKNYVDEFSRSECAYEVTVFLIIRSESPEFLLRSDWFLTASDSASGEPTKTQSCLARVSAV